MFVVRDWTRNPSYTMVSNDVKDVRDIVIGITGDETIGDHVLLHLGHSMGMTDNQYKGMLLDQLEDWQEVLDLAIKAGNTEIQEKVEKQIRKINEKLKF